MDGQIPGMSDEPNKKSHPHSSTHKWPVPVAFALVVAVFGGYLIINSFASTQIVASLDAENMTLPKGASVSSASPSGGLVEATEDGVLTGSVTIPANTNVSSLSVMAEAGSQSCSAKPEMSVALDGTSVIPSTKITSTALTSYSGNLTITTGASSSSHTLTITLSNIPNGTKSAASSRHHRNENSGGNRGGSSCNDPVYLNVTDFYGATQVSAPTITSFTGVSPVSSGSTSQLSWSTSAPTGTTTTCTISGSNLSESGLGASGSVTSGTLTNTTTAAVSDTFTLVCSDGSASVNTAQATTTVQVSPAASTTGSGGSGGSGSTGGSGGTTGYTLPPTKKSNGDPDQWYWEIDPANSGLAGLPSITDTTYPAPGSANIWDTDLFADASTLGSNNDPNAPSPVVEALHAAGDYSICYVEAGSYQTGFPDDSNYAPADYGNGASVYGEQGWSGEWWLNISGFAGFKYGQSTSSLTGTALNIAEALNDRFEGCKAEGQDAIEPDDLDGYTNQGDTGVAGGGWGLTQADSAGFEAWIATAAHADGLAVFQKNDPGNSGVDEPYFDGMIIEECNYYNDPCSGPNGDATAYLTAGKPVLNAEYTSDGETTAKFCSADESAGITGALFDLNLDGKTYQPCED